jgi:hypothetical protein
LLSDIIITAKVISFAISSLNIVVSFKVKFRCLPLTTLTFLVIRNMRPDKVAIMMTTMTHKYGVVNSLIMSIVNVSIVYKNFTVL